MVSLIGREREAAAIDAMLERSPEQGDALIVRGPAGIGKTALLEAATSTARERGMAVMSTAGVEGEAHLPFAGLHLLLLPLQDAVAKLPARQREALNSAFGLGEARVEPFLIAMAVLTLLTEAAAAGPLLVVVDDVHWLDAPTVEALAFVARRIRADPIAVLFATRDDHPTHLDHCGLSELPRGGLDRAAAETLLDQRASRLGAGARRRVLAEADGNPLALVELPQVANGEPEPAVSGLLPLTARLERAFAVRLADLPPPTRALLLAAAADDGRHLATALAAGSLMTGEQLTVAALTPATERRLVELTASEFRFRHPLVRSAVYHRATPAERLAVHNALAEIHDADPDRQAWHRAAAVSHPDAAVATELVNVARRAHQRGAVVAAVAALRRSAQLTEGPALRANRLLQAAELAFELGGRDLLADLLTQVDPGVLTDLGQARLTWLQEVLEEGRTPLRRLVGTIESVSTLGDTALAMNFVRAAAIRCWWTEPGSDVRLRVAELAERLAPSADDPELLACLSLAAGLERGDQVIERLVRLRGTPFDGVQNRLLGVAATGVGAFDLAGGFLEAAVAELRAQGRLGPLTLALSSQVWEQIFCGDWAGANLVAGECERLARETGQSRWLAAALAARALLAGLRGQTDLGRALAAEAERALGPQGVASVLALVLHARGVIALCAGQYAEAFGHLRRIADPQDVAYHPRWRLWSVSELAEAAVGSGQEDAFRGILADMEKAVADAPAPLAHVGLRHARALLADAEPLYATALAADLTRWPTARARLWLAHGVWLRRHKRVKEARESLRIARDTCDALGLVALGERARRELRAAGEAAAGRTPAGSDNLSAQELQIARLAAAGLTNREIGQQLYLSHRTVSTHLYRIFPKLGISARAQLRDALGL
ncbi:AAA family ATPase [Nonomuraea rubra]|uniref:AAA family ATPase n=1 Tax=Nonomuraea rubra TaxID=46180 RepID=UPI0036D3959E